MYSAGIGYVTFVRGSDENDNNDMNADNNVNDENVIDTTPIDPQSKESRIAQLYREKIYHPFI